MNEKLKQELKNKIRIIPNFPKKGILFQDVTSITDNSDLFKKVIRELSIYAKKNKISKIAGIEARGFIFGAAVANQCNLPFIPIRKKDKLPGANYKQKYKLEYGDDEVQVHKDAANSKDRILIIDDLIATGGTAKAAAKLINKLKPKEIRFHFIIDLNNLGGFKKIRDEFEACSLIKSTG
jgi:adenine phosphoribosyltransferase